MTLAASGTHRERTFLGFRVPILLTAILGSPSAAAHPKLTVAVVKARSPLRVSPRLRKSPPRADILSEEKRDRRSTEGASSSSFVGGRPLILHDPTHLRRQRGGCGCALQRAAGRRRAFAAGRTEGRSQVRGTSTLGPS